MPSPIAPGFNDNALPPNDDDSTGLISITQAFGTGGLNFFGTHYNALFVNNNGNVTFQSATGQYTPNGLGAGYTGNPIIAAFFGDVDTEGFGSGLTKYGFGTFNGHNAFGVTWQDVGYFDTRVDKLNSFQLILVDRPDAQPGDFDIYFNYGSITWETGEASGGVDGLGGVSVAVGFSAGTAQPGTYFQFNGSLVNGALIDGGPNALSTHTNDGVPGQYVFQVRNGQITAGNGSGGGDGQDPNVPPVPPHPVSFSVTSPGLVHEGDSGATPFDFVVHRTGSDLSGASVVNWSLHVEDPNDLVPGQRLEGQFVMAPFQTEAVVHVNVQGDKVYEQDDMVLFRLDHVTFGTEAWEPDLGSVGIILNDDPQTLFAFAGPQLRPEGQLGATPMEFIVTRSGDLQSAATVQWRLDYGTADALDLAPDQPTSGVIAFAPNATQAVIQVLVQGDARLEPDETFTVRLTSATVGTAAPVQLDAATTGTIVDDDTRQSLLVATPNTLVLPEGGANTATAFDFTIMRVGDASQSLAVPYTVSLPVGGLSASEIQSPLQGVVTFDAGADHATITVLVAGDFNAEDNEAFQVTVGGGSLNTLMLTGVAMNDDKAFVAAATGTDVPVAAPGDVSLFMQQLAGGGLWSDAAGL